MCVGSYNMVIIIAGSKLKSNFVSTYVYTLEVKSCCYVQTKEKR